MTRHASIRFAARGGGYHRGRLILALIATSCAMSRGKSAPAPAALEPSAHVQRPAGALIAAPLTIPAADDPMGVSIHGLD